MQSTDQLFAACKSGDVNIVSRLLPTLTEINLNTIKWSIPKHLSGGLTLLTQAASKGHAEICQMLLDKGADVNQESEGIFNVNGFMLSTRVDQEGTTPLIGACHQGHLKVVRMLLAVGGIQVNQANNNGWTPLSTACEKDHSKVVEMLLAATGIQVNQANNNGTTPLSKASKKGHSKVVKMLLAVDGIQVNQADSYGFVPLYEACANGHSKVVKMLLAVDGIK